MSRKIITKIQLKGILCLCQQTKRENNRGNGLTWMSSPEPAENSSDLITYH